jgi:serine/threonine-protein kinase
MAPEQATGKTIDHRCDQFAFGILLFEMLNGRRAFERSSHVESSRRSCATSRRRSRKYIPKRPCRCSGS